MPPRQILISSLFYYREELGPDFISSLWRQANAHVASTPDTIEICIVLNYPASPGYPEALRAAAPPLSDRVKLTVISQGWNAGFGAAHNSVFARSPSDFLIVLNSDLICESPDWIGRMMSAFDRPEVGLVGAAENASLLRHSDACGLPAPSPDDFDFVDASLMAVRSADARKIGLFHPDFHYFYFEDSDLCLRFRQAGRRITLLSLPHRHLRYGGTRLIPRRVVQRVLDENRGSFFSHWGGQLAAPRSFHGRILADLSSLALTELDAAVPALLALARDHAGAQRFLRLSSTANDWWLREAAGWRVEEPPGPVDRTWMAPSLTWNDPRPPVLQLLADLPGSPDWVAVEATLRHAAGATATESPPHRRAFVALDRIDPNFPGLHPEPAALRPCIQFLLESGWQVTVVGTGFADLQLPADARLREVQSSDARAQASLLIAADCVIAPAGPILELAQLLRRPTLAICGAVNPLHCVFAWESTNVFTAPLSCVGCHLACGRAGANFCLRRDMACMSVAQADGIRRALEQTLAGDFNPLGPALRAEQARLRQPVKASPDLDLSKWPED